MANDYGMRIEHEDATDTGINYRDKTRYKDISSLGVIAPFTITARVRVFAYNPGKYMFFVMMIEYGGAEDDMRQWLFLRSFESDAVDEFGSVVNNTSIIDPFDGEYDDGSITDIEQEKFFWIEIQVDEDRNFTVKLKEDETTTRPTGGWDEERTNPISLNATEEQAVQLLRFSVVLRNDDDSQTQRGIFEIDEIYVDQD